MKKAILIVGGVILAIAIVASVFMSDTGFKGAADAMGKEGFDQIKKFNETH